MITLLFLKMYTYVLHVLKELERQMSTCKNMFFFMLLCDFLVL